MTVITIERIVLFVGRSPKILAARRVTQMIPVASIMGVTFSIEFPDRQIHSELSFRTAVHIQGSLSSSEIW